MDAGIKQAVDVVWDYMLLREKVGPAECMVVLGSRDDRVAAYAAELTGRFTYNHVLVTGGVAHEHDMLRATWKGETEAQHFAEVLRTSGYQGDLLLEQSARNTGENARLSHKLLESIGVRPKSILLLTKPYMERRAKATFEKQWPEPGVKISVTSQELSFDEYVDDAQPAEIVINIMVGDLQRIIEYPKLGYQSHQHVPADVLAAFELLLGAGFTKHAIK